MLCGHLARACCSGAGVFARVKKDRSADQAFTNNYFPPSLDFYTLPASFLPLTRIKRYLKVPPYQRLVKYATFRQVAVWQLPRLQLTYFSFYTSIRASFQVWFLSYTSSLLRQLTFVHISFLHFNATIFSSVWVFTLSGFAPLWLSILFL